MGCTMAETNPVEEKPSPPADWLEQACKARRVDDFTIHCARHESADGGGPAEGDPFTRYFMQREGPAALDAQGAPQRKTSYDFSIDVGTTPARVHVCSCSEGQEWSATVRWDTPKALKREEHAGQLELETNWRARASYSGEKVDEEWVKNANLFSFSETVDVLTKAFGKSLSGHARGFLLVTGGTGSGKSQISRGLVHEYLSHLSRKGRHPHVLTHEDPIERRLFEPLASQAQTPDERDMASSRAWIDYTPRQLRKDTGSLEETLQSALRQKPAVVYVGEVRKPDELRQCIEFGGTGHFIIATAHAGSLVESVEKVLSACEAREPGTRALWVPKLLGIVHLQSVSVRLPADKRYGSAAGHELSGILPALYRNNSQGRQMLIADGLASLLPHAPRDCAAATGTLGRKFFARELSHIAVAKIGGADDVQATWQAIRDYNKSQGLLLAAQKRDLYGE